MSAKAAGLAAAPLSYRVSASEEDRRWEQVAWRLKAYRLSIWLMEIRPESTAGFDRIMSNEASDDMPRQDKGLHDEHKECIKAKSMEVMEVLERRRRIVDMCGAAI